MSNMSYCRFENTASDLHDCLEALTDDGIPESKHERKAAERMRQYCEDYVAEYDAQTEDDS